MNVALQFSSDGSMASDEMRIKHGTFWGIIYPSKTHLHFYRVTIC
jgi:hypothetical protein